MASADGRNRSLCFLEDVPTQTQVEATRRDRSLLRIVWRPWMHPREELAKYPSITRIGDPADEKNEETMPFHTEPHYFIRTAMSDLQGAWGNLRHAVVEQGPFPDCDRLLFHIDEGMSWECVRDLDRMHGALLVVRNIAAESKVPDDVVECIEYVQESFDEAVTELQGG